jgi:type III pantothenate kinase
MFTNKFIDFYLIIDIGNTLQKAAIFSQSGEMVFCESDPNLKSHLINSMIKKHNITKSILSTVGEERKDIIELLEKHTKYLPFTHQTKVPITIEYKDPQTLGLDRIANAVAAASLFPNENVLSIQAGSCIVYDFITSAKRYEGGAISPGIDMRFKALHQFTANLPEIKRNHKNILIGKTTQQSIQSGVINGVIHEIEGNIKNYFAKYKPLKAVLTGGDSTYLHKLINFTIFAAPNLVLSGLYIILKSNE